MTMANKTGSAGAGALKMRVEGMDCGACATKVETALKRLPGVSDINMNFATTMLSLRLDEDRTSVSIRPGPQAQLASDYAAALKPAWRIAQFQGSSSEIRLAG
jgi:copper chaperone CopZ